VKEDLMNDVNVLAIVVASVAVLVLSTMWYMAFDKQLAQLSPAYADAAANARPPAWKVAVELVRSLVVASVVAGLAALLDIADSTGAVQLGFSLWIGFPVVLWTGAILHERVPAKLAAIHAGDWLLKLLVIAVVVSVWN
jgi:Protein of unknown function (DUF1761)